MSDTPETDGLEAHKDDAGWRLVVPSKFARRLERERDEARRKMDEARRALEWISKRYCYEKTTSQLAVEAYEMFSMARWTLQGMTLEEGA